MLIGSYTTPEARLRPSALKDKQFYFFLEDESENYHKWVHFLVAYVLFVDLLEDKKKEWKIPDSYEKQSAHETSKPRKKKTSKRNKRMRRPTTALKKEENYPLSKQPNLYEARDSSFNACNSSETPKTDREQKGSSTQILTVGHQQSYSTHNSISAPDSATESEFHQREANVVESIPEHISHTHDSCQAKVYATEKLAIRHFHEACNAKEYRLAKKFFKKCIRICHKLCLNGDVALCYRRLSEVACINGFYRKARQFYKKIAKLDFQARLLPWEEISLSAIHIQSSYTFCSSEQFDIAYCECLNGIMEARTIKEQTVSHLCCGDINKSMKKYTGALVQYGFSTKIMNINNNCLALLAHAHRKIGELYLYLCNNKMALFHFLFALRHLDVSDYSFDLISQLVRLLPVPCAISKLPGYHCLSIVDLTCVICRTQSDHLNYNQIRFIIQQNSSCCSEIVCGRPTVMVNSTSTDCVSDDVISENKFECAQEEQYLFEHEQCQCTCIPFNGSFYAEPSELPAIVQMFSSPTFDDIPPLPVHLYDGGQVQPNYAAADDGAMPNCVQLFVGMYGSNYRGTPETIQPFCHCALLLPTGSHNFIVLEFVTTSHQATILFRYGGYTLLVWFDDSCHLARWSPCLNRISNELRFNHSVTSWVISNLQTAMPMHMYTINHDKRDMSSLSTVVDSQHIDTVQRDNTDAMVYKSSSPIFVNLSENNKMCIIGHSIASKLKLSERRVVCLHALPLVRKEVQIIARILRTKPLLDTYATKDSVLSMMNNSRIIHLATHGIFLNNGNFSLILHPGRFSNDSLLTPHDVEKLHLSASMVVLSSCDSGRGMVKADGIQGMARAFILAGAQSVLTTLWKVPDESASVFMQFFYHFLVCGHPSHEAIKRAKISMRFFQEYEDVVHWDGYQLHGHEIIIQQEQPNVNNNTVFQFGGYTPFVSLQVMHNLEEGLINQPLLTAIQVCNI